MKVLPSIRFFAAGIPKAQPRPRAFARKMGSRHVARVYDDATAEGWKSAVAVAWKASAVDLPPPYRVVLVFHLPSPKAFYRASGELKPSAPYYHTKKPDADNLAKAVLDALSQVGAWRDDCEVAELSIAKTYQDHVSLGCWIEITSLPPNG
jgi:Holliday junction resolvase RusA-like endonuclease